MGYRPSRDDLADVLTTDFSEVRSYFPLAKEGDIVYDWSNESEAWASLCGMSGVCLVRDGEIIESVLLLMN